jgi:hypothetical protein
LDARFRPRSRDSGANARFAYEHAFLDQPHEGGTSGPAADPEPLGHCQLIGQEGSVLVLRPRRERADLGLDLPMQRLASVGAKRGERGQAGRSVGSLHV